MSSPPNALGDFLRAQRGRVDAQDVGIHSGGHRRVPGLRREEVAVLAGVSADYYARLEQGRERNPSAPVVDALGRALRFDADTRAHAFRLAGLSPSPVVAPGADPRSVHPELLRLLDAFPDAAAYVLGPSFDVLATNALATALLAPFGDRPNMVRVLFEDPLARAVFAEWPLVTRATVHALRLNAGRFPGDAELGALVADLLATSPAFAALWEDQGVGSLARAYKVFVHPEAGRVELTYQTFDVHDAPGQQLLVGTPAPGSVAAVARLRG